MKALKWLALAVVFALCATSAQANIITGSLWHVPEATSLNAIPTNVPGTPADVTFKVNSPMNFSGTDATVGNWLASSGAFLIAENTPGTLASLMDNGTWGTMLRFTGFVTVTHGQEFTVTHDDGLSLFINGIDLGFNAGPTPPIVSTATYTGATGTFGFELVYGECCGGPAVLQVDLPFTDTPVPEPASFLLVATGLAGLTRLRRRNK